MSDKKKKKCVPQKKGEIQYRQYENSDFVEAARKVTIEKFTVYKASKVTGVPYNTFKRFINDNNDLLHVNVPKLGRPFALPVDLEQKILKYILDMQELGFGLTVLQVRKLAYQLAEIVNRQHMFNEEKKSASKWWWCKFKERYNLCLRVPENLSAYRASMSNPVIIADYFSKLENLLLKLDLFNKPSQIWNVDETGLTYVVKPNKIVCQIGKKYVYKRTYGERGQTQTVIGCASADGSFLPPFVIFKGVRWDEALKNGSLPHSITRLSPKGWITSALFLEWFKFSIESIGPQRPVLLLMDSHSSHIGPEIISLAKENSVFLMTFPPHTSHLLQPLDVGVYKSLKSHWSKELNSFMVSSPAEKPSRYQFHKLFTPAFIASFTQENIRNAFKKSGSCPFNSNAVAPEALGPSKLTEKLPPAPESRAQSLFEIDKRISKQLETPSVQKPNQNPSLRGGKQKRCAAECLTPIEDVAGPSHISSSPVNDPAVGLPGPSKTTGKKKKGAKCSSPVEDSAVAGPSNIDVPDDDWVCGMCCKKFSEDVKKKTGLKWIQCSFCFIPYHEKCQKQPTKEDIYMCDACGDHQSEDDEDYDGSL
ncbi:tigger transposable element-derived protein 1-like [Nilaparvata lugens]|uniref:tigger transposable element-derived protein 1-like n=1 Tax=Nilaparvata lugens TaxID=108931 RepID=UPI00193E2D14|nr:tigger transposable element-derived protein 1-like [Nilaparvata lugens]XP_039296638.1 tigger transposable element-derived protein 1-like [Nilaparvata lugens]